jgi:serine protease AprX
MMMMGTLIGMLLLLIIFGCMGTYSDLLKSLRPAFRLNTVTWNQSSIWKQDMRKTYRLASLTAVLLLLATAIGPAAMPVLAKAANAQPELVQMAVLSPAQQVGVIVQKVGKGTAAEEMVARLGGEVTRDLHIINAFAAQMTAGAARELASNPTVRWVSLDTPVRQSDASDREFTTWATAAGTVTAMGFTNSAAMFDSGLGSNGLFGYGANVKGALRGFVAEATPGYSITRVEAVLPLYMTAILGSGEDPMLNIYVGGAAGQNIKIMHQSFDPYVGAANTGLLYVDITGSRTWHWADFDNNLELQIDQTKLAKSHFIYYDAIGLRVTSAPGVDASGDTGGDTSTDATLDTTKLTNVYNQIIGASQLWNSGAKLRGKGVAIAVVDSGIYKTKDIDKRLRSNVNFNADYHDASDRYGHGTFVAGIAVGNGSQSGYKYMGVAPRADVLNVRVSNDQGMSLESDVINGLQWVLENKSKYNIRIVNLSLNSSVAQSYHTSPLDAACEILWFNGIVVVAAAGNNGSATLFPPANDPFVITVGATDDKGTLSTGDDGVASFSAYGTTESGFAKPDLVTPGRNIIGLLPENDKLSIGLAHPANRIDKTYFKMSGTSASAPMVSGAIALLLQDEPNLNPDQVKYRLKATANKIWVGYNATTAGAGYLDINAAVNGTTTQSANTGILASSLLSTGSTPITWGSVGWNSVGWNSVGWNSVGWNSVGWNSVGWNSDYWGN